MFNDEMSAPVLLSNFRVLVIGQEELAKRGCYVRDVTTLDLDMKVRYLTFEEILHTIGGRLVQSPDFGAAAPWWDIECDVSLLVGTIIHGLGNYRNIMMDNTLPLANKLSRQKLFGKMTKSTNFNILRRTFLSIAVNMTKSELSSCSNNVETHQESELNAYSTRRVRSIKEVLNLPRYPITERSLHFISARKSLTERFIDVLEAEAQDVTCDLDSFVSISDLDNRLYSLISLLDDSETKQETKEGGPDKNIVLQSFCDIMGCSVMSRTVFRSDFIWQLPESSSLNATTPRLVLSRRGLISLVYFELHNFSEWSSFHMDDSYHNVTSRDTSNNNGFDPRSDAFPTELSGSILFRHAISAALLCLGTHSSPKFIPVVNRLSGKSFPLSQDAVNVYVQKYFIPHCVDLCLCENEEDCNDYGNSFDSETPFWPDPLESYSKHGWRSREIALSILRRLKLFKCIKNIVQLPEEEILKCIESISSLKNYFPVWWNSKMSLKLLRHVAKFGLLCVLFERKEGKDNEFDDDFIQSQVRRVLLDGEDDAKLPVFKKLLEKFRADDVEDFVKRQATVFPGSRVILCFLSVVANKVSLSHLDTDWAFIDLPVLDEEIFI
jgi:hypothetical protein